jgi:hypothetical protein
MVSDQRAQHQKQRIGGERQAHRLGEHVREHEPVAMPQERAEREHVIDPVGLLSCYATGIADS